MATNLALDDSLISQAQKVVHHRTKKDAVTTALKEYIARKNKLKYLTCSVKLTSIKTMIIKKQERDESSC